MIKSTENQFKPSFGYMTWRWGFWIRIFRKGIWLAVDDNRPLLFSERYGYTKVWRFCWLKLKLLD